MALIPDDAPRHDDESDDSDLSDTLRGAGPWREVELAELFPVGDLHDYTASDQRLTDIAGLGPGKAGNIEERLIGFWEAYEEPAATA